MQQIKRGVDYVYTEISALIGKTLTKIEQNGDQIDFYTDKGEVYVMFHSQDCCESIEIEDICGDFDGRRIHKSRQSKGQI